MIRDSFIKAAKAVSAAALIASLGFAFSGMECLASTVDVDWDYLYLDEDGASWSCETPSGLEVERYELSLSRERNGSWDYDYRTIKTRDDETSCDITYTATGRYYYIARVRFVGGEYSDWSDIESNTISITSDDIDHDYSGGSAAVTYITSQSGPGSGSTTTTNGTITQSGWIREGNYWIYRYANGTQPKNTWDMIDGKWYYFNSSGYMKTGWIWYNNQWYYCLPSGAMTTGWNNVNEKWYYFNESGIMQTGYIVVDGKTYYTDSSGARVQSAYNPDGHLFDLNGVMVQ